jgi:hypothetical protein
MNHFYSCWVYKRARCLVMSCMFCVAMGLEGATPGPKRESLPGPASRGWAVAFELVIGTPERPRETEWRPSSFGPNE